MLALFIAVRVSHQMHQQSLGYSYGYTGTGANAGNPFYEMRSSFPLLAKNYAMVAGPAFSIAYGCGGIFMGLLVDKIKRKYLLSLVCLLWSMTSLITGATNSFLVLVMMRFLLGLCIAGTEPSCYSMLGDYFPKKMRTTANSLFNTAQYIGGGLISLSVIIISNYGWRNCYKLVGGLGVLLSVATALFIREPERGRQLRIEFENKKRLEERERAAEPVKDFTTMNAEKVEEIIAEKEK